MTSKNIVSGSVTEVTTDYSAFTWTVYDFHLCDESCCEGKSFTSPEFITKIISNTGQQIGENIWKLAVYRSYSSPHYYMLIRINCQNIQRKLYISLSILDSKNSKVSKITNPVANLELTESETKVLYCPLAHIWNKMNTGHLKLLCELSTNRIKRIKIVNELESLSNDLAINFEDNNTSDVVIVVGDEKFYVHKAILMSRSSVFRAMFENDMKEKRENTVNIPNFDSKVIQEMLRFIYTGKVKNINGFERILLSAADQYELESLKITCANILCENLKVENACEMIVLANQYRLTHFRNEILEFIAYNVNDIIDSKYEDLNVQ